jgi:glycerol uptake facilitator-like aquaporin
MPSVSSYEEQQMRVIFEEVIHQSGKGGEIDENSKLSKEMLGAALTNMGKTLSDQELNDVFALSDANGDGGVSFEEFCIVSQMPEESNMDLARCCLAEFIGVALFQFFGGMPNSGAIGNGLALIVLIYGTASISGGHLNPAVSAALAVTQQITPIKMALYMLSQLLGGICGAAMVYAIDIGDNGVHKIFTAGAALSSDFRTSCTLPGLVMDASGNAVMPLKTNLSGGQVFGVEFLATFTLVFTVFATAVDPRGAAGNAAPWAIGGSLWATAMGIGPLTGGALNPARTLCPAIVFNCWKFTGTGIYERNDDDTFWYFYVLAQLLAGCAAGLIYKFAFLNRPDDGQPGPASVFQFVARDGMATKRGLAAAGKTDIEATPAPAPEPVKAKGPITPRGKKPITPKGMVKVIDHGKGTEQAVPISQMI